MRSVSKYLQPLHFKTQKKCETVAELISMMTVYKNRILVIYVVNLLWVKVENLGEFLRLVSGNIPLLYGRYHT